MKTETNGLNEFIQKLSDQKFVDKIYRSGSDHLKKLYAKITSLEKRKKEEGITSRAKKSFNEECSEKRLIQVFCDRGIFDNFPKKIEGLNHNLFLQHEPFEKVSEKYQ